MSWRSGWLLADHRRGSPLLPVETLRHLGDRGIVRANFSTDDPWRDPWSPAHRSRWFLDALSGYDVIFNPRRAAVDDFRRAGCRRVEYLPFAYDPKSHFPEAASPSDLERFACDVAVGGADADRVPYVEALREGGLRVRVFGAYWDRHAGMQSIWGGSVIGGDYRRCVSAAKVNLCLVRRANRDGHVMRTFELAAMRACVLAEDTPEHREIYGGSDDGCVRYFRTLGEMVEQARGRDENARAVALTSALHRVHLSSTASWRHGPHIRHPMRCKRCPARSRKGGRTSGQHSHAHSPSHSPRNDSLRAWLQRRPGSCDASTSVT